MPVQVLWRTIFIASIILAIPDQLAAQDRGLNNSTKKFTRHKDMKVSDFDDPKQILRTWKAAIVRMPTGVGRSKRTTFAELDKRLSDGTTKFPTAIYMHGCAGIWPGTHRRIKFLADNGFLVIAPASLARTKYPKSCDPPTHEGGMYNMTVWMRKLDAGYAIETAKTLPYVDGDNMLLIGLSEGGITTATFRPANKRQAVRARVVEGWTCTTGIHSQVGISAPQNEPVLSLIGVKDPWFQHPVMKGDCSTFMNRKNGSKSIVYRKGILSRRHELLEFKQVKTVVLSFLRAHMDLPLSVKQIQQALKKMGFNPGPADGAWGAKTLEALNRLREKHGLGPVKKLEKTSQKLFHRLRGK